MLRALVCVLLVAFSVAAPRVRLNVMMDTESDPVFTLNAAEEASVRGMLPALPQQVMRPIPWYRVGYRGFEVNFDGTEVSVYNHALLEITLLAAGMRQGAIPPSVAAHVTEEIERVTQLRVTGGLDKVEQEPVQSTLLGARDQCSDTPIRGPDNSTVYDPRTDCRGCFITRVTENNCYNYGSDVLTNSFAQPGRGTGQKWRVNTCDEMRAASERDGLIWAGNDLPTKAPETGHYVSLHIWPNTNFHWARRDTSPDGYWSHKPGGTAVRNVDSRGQKVTDPSKSNFAPWTEFCGYMLVIPSKITIN